MTPAPAYDLLRPIEGEDPSGPSLRYDPLYEKIRQARRQDLGGAVVDGVPKVADHKTAAFLISDALATRSKDLQLAVWLADSLIHREGFAGLRRGLDLISDLLLGFWETIHPQPDEPGDYEIRMATLEWLGSEPKVSKETCPIISARFVPITQSGLKWIDYDEKGRKDASADKVEAFEAAFQATPKSFYRQSDEALEGCMQALARLRGICDERFGRDGPGFGGLAQALEEIRNTVRSLLRRKLEADPDPVEIAVPAAKPSVPAFDHSRPAPPVVSPETPDEPPAADFRETRDAVASVLAAARYFRRLNPASPLGYLLVRVLRWSELRSGGDGLDPALLTAPPTAVRAALKSFAAAGNWADLLEAAERAAGAEFGRGWLDVHRYAVMGCEELGYMAAAHAIRSELACLLSDYPQLASATLLDDTGAANPETAAWLTTVRQRD